MFVHRSSDLESLVDALGSLVRAPHPGGILAPEVVLIQSAGMERYLARGLSQRLGIAARFEFPYPRAFLHQLLSIADAESSYSKSALRWDYFLELEELTKKFSKGESIPACFSEFCAILLEDPGGQKRLDLASQLAALTDQYLTFRKEMILAWQAGDFSAGPKELRASGANKTEAQARLFHSIYEKKGLPHLSDKVELFLKSGLSPQELEQAPKRISIIGGPGLPPLYLQVLAELSKQIEVHLFALSVSESYLGDEKSLSVQQALSSEQELASDTQAVVSGQLHPLLAAWGKVGADFQQVMEDSGYTSGHEQFAPRGSRFLLTALQQDLLNGALRKKEDLLPETALKDGSITIDAVHSPMRELEVLKQRIIGWMQDDPTLRPDEIVILTPNMERYASLVPIVFDRKEGDDSFIPYRVADQSPLNPAFDALLRIFSALNSRLATPEFVDLLHLSPIALRFNWEREELEQLREWLTQAQCAWGLEADDWRERGINIELAPTIELALKRLVYGFAHRCDDISLLKTESSSNGIAPSASVGPGDAELIGQLYQFVRTLKSLRRVLKGKLELPLATWLSLIQKMSAGLTVDSPSGEWEMSLALKKLEESLPAEDKREQIHLSHRAMFRLLNECWEVTGNAANFLAGGLTFCNLLPLRTIPFRCVCVLGLGQAEFPRSENHVGLDVMMSEPRPGDRSLRADDRYLFLEILLAARQHLALSYVGVDAATLRVKPASPLITDLQAVLARMTNASSENGSLREAVPIKVHPLQPYSTRYFSQLGELRSFDRQAFRTAESLASKTKEPTPTLTERPLPVATAEEANLSLESLANFFSDVHKGYFQRVGVYASYDDVDLLEREKWSLNHLERYQVLRELLEGVQANDSRLFPSLKGASRLPVGNIAQIAYDDVSRNLKMIWQAMASIGISINSQESLLSWNDSLQSTSLTLCLQRPEEKHDLGVQTWIIEGQLAVETSGRYVELSPSKCDFKRKVRFLVRHLALCAAGLCRTDSAWLGVNDKKPCAFLLKPLEKQKAREALTQLLLLREEGFRKPLPFVGSLAEAYVKKLSGKDKSPALEATLDAGMIHLDYLRQKAAKDMNSQWTSLPYLALALDGRPLFGVSEEEERNFEIFHQVALQTQGRLQELESNELNLGATK